MALYTPWLPLHFLMLVARARVAACQVLVPGVVWSLGIEMGSPCFWVSVYLSAPDLCGSPTLHAFPAAGIHAPISCSQPNRWVECSEALSGWDRKPALPLPTETCVKHIAGISDLEVGWKADFVL